MNLTISFRKRDARAKGQKDVINCVVSIGGVRAVAFSAMKVKPAISRLFDKKI